MVSMPFRNLSKFFPSSPCMWRWIRVQLMEEAEIITVLTLLPIFAGHLSLCGQLLQQAAENVALIWPLLYGPPQDIGSIPAGHWRTVVFSLFMTKSVQMSLALRLAMFVETTWTFLSSASFWFPSVGYATAVERITVSSCGSILSRES